MAGSPIVAGLRYRDADGAVDALCAVLGFEEHNVFRGEDGKVAHAELRLGSGVVMVAPALDSPWGRLMKLPDEVGGFGTQGLYIVVPDADAVLARVESAGWEVVIEIKDQPYGGRDFTCRDPGGHVWSVGTYDPWAPG